MKKVTWTIAALLALYVAAYLVLLKPDSFVIPGGGPPYYLGPIYRAGGEVAEAAFRPIHLVDRLLRPERWQVPNEDLPDVIPFRERPVVPLRERPIER